MFVCCCCCSFLFSLILRVYWLIANFCCCFLCFAQSHLANLWNKQTTNLYCFVIWQISLLKRDVLNFIVWLQSTLHENTSQLQTKSNLSLILHRSCFYCGCCATLIHFRTSLVVVVVVMSRGMFWIVSKFDIIIRGCAIINPSCLCAKLSSDAASENYV